VFGPATGICVALVGAYLTLLCGRVVLPGLVEMLWSNTFSRFSNTNE
jgi:hypothetical protein